MATFSSISQVIVREYVRSALIIDDQWPEQRIDYSDDDTGEPDDQLADGAQQSDIEIVDVELPSEAAQPGKADDVDAEILDHLRHRLLREGILTCGLRYRHTDRAMAIELARRADIVVLDWHLVGDDGSEALEILRPLRGDCLWFICIWTGHGRAEEVRERLIQGLGPCEPTGEFRKADLRIGNLAIAIRIKQGLGEEPELAVGPEQFLEVVVQGLASSFGGLVQLAILEMTTRHREHLPEILDHIGSPIDIAILLEAGDKNSPAAPGGALVAVLVDEWRSRLEQHSDKLKSLSEDGLRAFGAKLRSERGGDWTDRMQKLLAGFGINPQTAKQQTNAIISSADHWLEEGCRGDIPQASQKSARLVSWAALLSTSGYDQSMPPLLHLDALFHQQFNLATSLTQGTIVSITHNEKTFYLICITPLCDAVRPEGIGRLFTFARSRVVPPEEVFKGGSADHYCVVRHGKDWLCLAVLLKERVSLEVESPQFSADGIVNARLSFGGSQEPLEEDKSIQLNNIAQLRLEHALHLAAAAAADASRIGVNKVEMIRTRIKLKG